MSNDFNYTLVDGDPTATIYEAYGSTDLMGFANLTIGRQALMVLVHLSTNDWGNDRTTWEYEV